MKSETGMGALAAARCAELGRPPYSEENEALTRRYLTPAHKATLEKLEEWMAEAGMSARLDAAGSLIGRYEGTKENAPALVIGSHVDSVRNAGFYDGPLGVMLGISCVQTLHARKKRFPFAIEVVAFGDEEGSRFPSSMLCSNVFSGEVERDLRKVERGSGKDETLLRDEAGVSLAEAMEAFGLDLEKIGDARRTPDEVFAYLEAHIEQGPVLETEGLPVGAVTGIAGQARVKVRIDGMAGHAGTTPMNLRHDALAAAAEAMLAIEARAKEGPTGLVATVGVLQSGPGATNVIPGRAEFTIDIRAPEDAIRDKATADIEKALGDICKRRGVALGFEVVQTLAAAPCDPKLTSMLADGIVDLGIHPRLLQSGAGHDAMVMSRLCPTAMIFIRCEKGISHNPAENIDPADADVAARVMLRFIEKLEDRFQK